MKCIKRDGRKVEFDKEKIVSAILAAFNEVDKEITSYAKDKAREIAGHIESLDTDLSVEDIQDIVEEKLMSSKRKDVAKAYVLYRNERTRARGNSTDKSILELLSGDNEYWNTENSNKNARLLITQRDYMAGILSTDITRRFLLPKDIVQAHDEGIIHFHDADYFAENAISNCCLINLDDMLQNGTCINRVRIEKPHTLKTATTVATQIITAVASSQYGGCTISLSALAPFVRDSFNRYFNKYLDLGFDDTKSNEYASKDTQKEIEDAVQTFNYQTLSMMTTNGQSPFLSVCMYLNESPEYIKENAMLIEEFLKQRIDGMPNEVGVKVTQAFPKLLYILDENNITEDSEYWYLTRLAAECTAKRLVPDYISAKMMKELKGDVYPCMGCRSFLTPDRTDGNIARDLNYRYGVGKYYGRFNQGVVTLNLVDIALSSNKDINKFWELFDERTELCHRALQIRHKRLLGTTSDVAPILWQDGAFARLDKGEKIDKLLFNGYSTISLGYGGLYECVKYMTGCSHADEGTGEKFGLEIMQVLNNKCNKWKLEENIDYSLYGSPMESTAGKFANCLKKRFGDDVFINIDGYDRDYIINSYHVNVREEINPYKKLYIESKFQKLSPGGSISYIETCDLTHNIPVVLDIIKYIYDNIMYAELNTKSDYCQVCGYDGEIKIIDEDNQLIWECPNCKNRDKNKLNVVRRTCGYCGTNFWSKGRTEDIRDRYVHIDDHIGEM